MPLLTGGEPAATDPSVLSLDVSSSSVADSANKAALALTSLPGASDTTKNANTRAARALPMPTPASVTAAHKDTTTSSKFGSSAGVLMASNQTKASAAASVALTPPPTSTDVTDTTTTPTDTTKTDTTTTPVTESKIDPTTLTPNAQAYVKDQKTQLDSELATATGQAQSDYNTAVSSVTSQANQQIETLTTQMNNAISGTQAELLAANPYASPTDPNVSGYIEQIRSEYMNQINTVRENQNQSINGLQNTLNGALATAKTSYDTNLAGIHANALTLSDKESNDIASKQNTEQTKFFSAIKTFTPSGDLSNLTSSQIMNDPQMSAYVQMGINAGMTQEQAISILKAQTSTAAPGMDGLWDKNYDPNALLGNTGLTYAAVQKLAVELNANKSMPSLGLGSTPSVRATRQAVINRAAALQPDGAATIAEQAYIKGASVGLNRAETLLTPASAAADKANKQIAIVKPLVDQLNFGNNFIYNSAKGIFETKGIVSPEVNTAVSAMTTLIQEYGKVQSGSTGAAGLTDAARQAATDTVNLYMGKESVDKILNLMQTEMGNTIQGYQDAIAAQTSNISTAAGTGSTAGTASAITPGSTTTSTVSDASAWPGF